MNGHLTQRRRLLRDLVDAALRPLARRWASSSSRSAWSRSSDLAAAQRGNAAGLFNLTRELGGSIGTAWMSTHLDRMTKQYSVRSRAARRRVRARSRRSSSAPRRAGLGARLCGRRWAPRSRRSRCGSILQALVRAFNEGFTTLGILFVASLAVVFFLKKPQNGVVPQGTH